MNRIYGKAALLAALLGAAMTGAGCAEHSYAQDDRAAGPQRAYVSGDYASDPHYATYQAYADQCGEQKHDRNVAGAVAGAVAGGLIGNAASSGGGRVGGTVIGAAAGAAVGSNVARATFHCSEGQPYWTEEQTEDYDSWAGYPGQHDVDWYREHDCRWARGDQHEYVRVCRGANDDYYLTY